VLICFDKIDKFDSTRGSSAFSYFTSVNVNCLRQNYRNVKNYNELKNKYHQFLKQFEDKEVKNKRTLIKNYQKKDII